jgi:hypothetical protein
MNNNILMLVFYEAQEAAKASNGTIVERLKAAMKATLNHYLAPDEDMALRAAIGGVMESYGNGSKEWELLEKEWKSLLNISTFLGAVQQGLKVELPEIDKSFEPVGIMKIWNESKDNAAPEWRKARQTATNTGSTKKPFVDYDPLHGNMTSAPDMRNI